MRIRIVENDAPTTLTDEQAAALDPAAVASFARRARAELGLIEPALEVVSTAGAPALRSRNVTGIGRFGGLDVEVVPKYLVGDPAAQDQWSQSFFAIILLAVTDAAVAPAVAAAPGGQNVLDALAESFATSAERGLAVGVPLRYESFPASGVFPEGPFDASRVVAWRARPWLTPYVRSELTPVSDLTRYLWWAIIRLRALPLSETTQRRIAGLSQRFRRLGIDREPRVPAQPPSQGRHRNFEVALLVADILRTAGGVDVAEGALALPGLFWPSAFVFERAARRLAEQLAPPLDLSVSKPAYRSARGLGGVRALRTQPDLTVRRKMTIVGILDAKYKQFSGSPDPSDSYQVVSGGLAAGCLRLALLYPHTATSTLGHWESESLAFPFELAALPLRLHLLGSGGASTVATELQQWLDAAAAPAGLTSE